MSKIKIVSGGQTGVDRAALDIPLQSDIKCGDWNSDGRKAEDGKSPFLNPVIELQGADC